MRNKTHHEIGNVDELTSEEFPLLVEIGEREIGIFKIDGEYYGVANYCPHANGPLCEGDQTDLIVSGDDESWKMEKEDQIIQCPWHRWKFDIKTGKNVDSDRFRTPTYSVEVIDEKLVVKL